MTSTRGKARSASSPRAANIEQRIRAAPECFAAVLGPRPRILIEASTDSEWVARRLEQLGHEVIVADPSFAPMYATRTRRIKADRRDGRALADTNLLGAYRPAPPCHAAAQPPARKIPASKRLRTVPSIGSVIAAALVASLDEAKRFRHAHQVGLGPRVASRSRKAPRLTR